MPQSIPSQDARRDLQKQILSQQVIALCDTPSRSGKESLQDSVQWVKEMNKQISERILVDEPFFGTEF